MNNKKIIAIIAFILIVLLVPIGAIFALANISGPLKESKTVTVPKGAAVSQIAKILENEEVIYSSALLQSLIKFKGLAGNIKAGEYEFSSGSSTSKVIKKLTDGNVLLHKITFPEGMKVNDVLKQILDDKRFVGTVQPMPEGSLFPDTYSFPRGAERMEIIRHMAARMNREVMNAWQQKSDESLVKTPEDLVILASIVEKETGSDGERGIIASVFNNRLLKNMRLQSDPTVIYGAKDYKGDITYKHLKDQNPYNTYVHKGLPPTPISIPGRASLLAVAKPEKTDFLYFVADGNGGHRFAVTHDEHQQNVRAYLTEYKQKFGK